MRNSFVLNGVSWGVAVGIVFVGIATAAFEPSFLSTANLSNIAVQLTVPGIVALGMTFVIVGGGIDLSVGSVVALAAIVFGLLARDAQSTWLALCLSILVGAMVGAVNGVLINWLRLAPFLATLGTMGVARGGAFLLSNGQPISGITGDLSVLYDTLDHCVPWSVVLLGFAIGIGSILLSVTAWGRRLYAIGSNERAARLTGIDVESHILASYALSGACAALAGVLVTARLDSAQPLAGGLYELDAIAAVVIGGGSLSGGRGSMLGSMLGVLLVVELRNAVTVLGLPTHSQPVVIGALLLAAAATDVRQHTSRERNK